MVVPLTVIVPASNSAGVVAAALASVRDQTYADFEVLVLDVCSTDATAEVLRACAGDDPRISLLHWPTPLTPPQARNLLLEKVQSEFLATLDHDDLMAPTRIEEQVHTLREQTDLLAVGGPLRRIDSRGMPCSGPAGMPPMRPTTPAMVQYILPFASPFLSSAATYRTAALRAVGGFAQEHPWNDDYATIWRLCRRGPVQGGDRVVGFYRTHREQLSVRRRDQQSLHLALLRREIVADRLGRLPALGSVLAWSRAFRGLGDDVMSQAMSDLRSVHEHFVAHTALTDEERKWVQQYHELMQQVVADCALTGSSATTPPSSPLA